MKLNKILLASATISILAACGGGGGNDQPTPTNKPTTTATTTPTATATTTPTPTATSKPTATPTNTPAPNSAVAGQHIYYDNGKAMTAPLEGTSDFKKIVVGGKEFAFDSTAIKDQAGFTGDVTKGILGSQLSNGIYGYFINDNVAHSFAQGLTTAVASMPTTGTATYKGNSVFFETDKKLAHYGNFSAKVDFAAKELSADLGLKPTTTQNTTIDKVAISGNSFAKSNGQDMFLQGSFYGDKAAEIGGTFQFDKWRGVGAFGGKKEEAAASK